MQQFISKFFFHQTQINDIYDSIFIRIACSPINQSSLMQQKSLHHNKICNRKYTSALTSHSTSLPRIRKSMPISLKLLALPS